MFKQKMKVAVVVVIVLKNKRSAILLTHVSYLHITACKILEIPNLQFHAFVTLNFNSCGGYVDFQAVYKKYSHAYSFVVLSAYYHHHHRCRHYPTDLTQHPHSHHYQLVQWYNLLSLKTFTLNNCRMLITKNIQLWPNIYGCTQTKRQEKQLLTTMQNFIVLLQMSVGFGQL